LSREEGDDSPLDTNPEIAALEREIEGLDLEKSKVEHLHRDFPEENTFSSEHEIAQNNPGLFLIDSCIAVDTE
jgi:hypothetical protein